MRINVSGQDSSITVVQDAGTIEIVNGEIKVTVNGEWNLMTWSRLYAEGLDIIGA